MKRTLCSLHSNYYILSILSKSSLNLFFQILSQFITTIICFSTIGFIVDILSLIMSWRFSLLFSCLDIWLQYYYLTFNVPNKLLLNTYWFDLLERTMWHANFANCPLISTFKIWGWMHFLFLHSLCYCGRSTMDRWYEFS